MQLWRCTVRTFGNECKAIVEEFPPKTYKEFRPHTCDPKTGDYENKLRLYAEIKQKAKEKTPQTKKTPTPRLVNPIAKKYFEQSVAVLEPGQLPLVVKKQTLERAANRIRSRNRPVHPSDLFFEPQTEHLPEDFLKKIVKVGKGRSAQRHFIFATDEQLDIARGRKRFYLDGTFRLAKNPFKQLFSIHGFIRSGEDMIQLPLVYVLMSRRRIADYRKVISSKNNLSKYYFTCFLYLLGIQSHQRFTGRQHP